MKYFAIYLPGTGYLCKKTKENWRTKLSFSYEDKPLLYRTEGAARMSVKDARLPCPPEIEEIEVCFSHKPLFDGLLPELEVGK